MGINDNLECYKESLSLYQIIYDSLGDRVNWVHYQQLFRAAGSVPANIAESAGRIREESTGDTTYRLAIARGSLFEVQAWLDIAGIHQLAEDSVLGLIAQKISELATKIKPLVDKVTTERSANLEYWQEEARKRNEARKRKEADYD